MGTHNNTDMFYFQDVALWFIQLWLWTLPSVTKNNRDIFYFHDVVLVITAPTQIQPAVSVNPVQ